MKKVLVATNSFGIGGLETNVLELVTGIKKSGKYDPVVISSGGDFVSFLEQDNIKHYNVHLNDKNPLFYIGTLYKINKIIKEEKIELIHSHARIPSFVFTLMLKKYCIPLITTVHYPYKINFIYKFMSKWGDKVITVSKDLADYVLDNYYVRNKDVSIVVNGIDTDKFGINVSNKDILLKHNISEDSNRIVHISRLDKCTCKTIDLLIDLFYELDNKIDNLVLIIVGDGTEYRRLLKKAQLVNDKLGREAIKFIGKVCGDVHKYTSLATLFIGVSRSALEAMSEKKCVILSGDFGYLGFFNKDKLEKAVKTNFCCRTESGVRKNILKKDIINYFNHMTKEEKEKMGKYNRSVVLKYFSKGKMVKDVCDIYDDMLDINKK